MTDFKSIRELSVRTGDALTMLMAYGPTGFPTEEGRTFDQYVSMALAMLAELATRTRVAWKRELLELTGLEVQQAHDAFVRSSDTSHAERLLRDAHDHFRTYVEGDPPPTMPR